MPDNSVGGAFEVDVLPTKKAGDIRVQSQTSDPYRTSEVAVITRNNQPQKKNNLGAILGSLLGNSLSFQAQPINTTPAPQKDNSVLYIILAIALIFAFAVYFSKKK